MQEYFPQWGHQMLGERFGLGASMPMSTCQLTVVCDTSRPLLLTPPNPSPILPKGLELTSTHRSEHQGVLT